MPQWVITFKCHWYTPSQIHIRALTHTHKHTLTEVCKNILKQSSTTSKLGSCFLFPPHPKKVGDPYIPRILCFFFFSPSRFCGKLACQAALPVERREWSTDVRHSARSSPPLLCLFRWTESFYFSLSVSLLSLPLHICPLASNTHCRERPESPCLC